MNNPMFKNGLVDGVFHLSKADIPELTRNYVAAMEVQRTNDWCKCEWIIHPDDADLDENNCGNCHHPQLLHSRQVGVEGCTKSVPIPGDGLFDEDCPCEGWVDPPKRRMRRGDTNEECPVHTKEGFLLGFFEWVFNDSK